MVLVACLSFALLAPSVRKVKMRTNYDGEATL